MTAIDRDRLRCLPPTPEPIRSHGRAVQEQPQEKSEPIVTRDQLRDFRETWKRANRMIELALDRLIAG